MRIMRVEGNPPIYRAEVKAALDWLPIGETSNLTHAMGKLDAVWSVKTSGGELVCRIPYGED
jgi:hypothetical protein